jgi:putative transposase
MLEELITTALQRALLAQQPVAGLLVHSDRRGQYCRNAYRTLLHRHLALRSQSRRGECYDNAQAENRLKVLGVSSRVSRPKSSKPENGQ